MTAINLHPLDLLVAEQLLFPAGTFENQQTSMYIAQPLQHKQASYRITGKNHLWISILRDNSK